MFRSIAFIALLLTLSAYGQEPTSVVQASKWSVGLNVSPDIAFRSLELVERNSASEAMMATLEKWEIPRFGYTASIMCGYAFNDRGE